MSNTAKSFFDKAKPDSAARLIHYGLTDAGNGRGALTHQKQASWSDIVDLFRKPVVRNITTAQYQALSFREQHDNKDTGLFYGGRCDGNVRRKTSIELRSLVNVDIDEGAEDLFEQIKLAGYVPGLENVTHVVHTTRSHTAALPKIRVLVPLSKDVLPEEYEPVSRAVSVRILPTLEGVDRKSYDPIQGMYIPSVSSDQEFFLWDHRADAFFDSDEALRLYPYDEPGTWPKALGEHPKAYTPGLRKKHPDEYRHSAPIITAVQNVFGPYAVLDDLLSEYYEPHNGRWAPVNSKGTASVRVYDNAFIHSDHATDPAQGQHTAFDVVRIVKFGKYDTESDRQNLFTSQMPSYRKAVDFFMEFDDIKEELARIAEEVEEEKQQDALKTMREALGLPDEPADIDPELAALGITPNTVPVEDELLKMARDALAAVSSASSFDEVITAIKSVNHEVLTATLRDMLVDDVVDAAHRIGNAKMNATRARKEIQPAPRDLKKTLLERGTPEWLQPFVFVESEDCFFNMNTCKKVTKSAFDTIYARYAAVDLGIGSNGLALGPPTGLAMQIYDTQVVSDLIYLPDGGLIVKQGTLLFANTYRRPDIATGGYTGDDGVKYLLRLLDDLFHEDVNRERVLDFIQHCYLRPQEKMQYALLVRGAEGEGKSLIGNLITNLVGWDNTAVLTPELLAEKHNGWARDRCFAMIDELRIAGKDAVAIDNKLKPLITDLRISLRSMGVDTKPSRNFLQIYATTNFDDALPITGDNSRWLILSTVYRNRDEVLAWRKRVTEEDGFDYVDRLYEHVTKHPAQFADFFRTRKFSEHYQPSKRAPMTHAKLQMIEAVASDEESHVKNLLDIGDNPTITEKILIWDDLKNELTVQGMGSWISGRSVSTFLRRLGFVKSTRTRIRAPGRDYRGYIWTRDTSLLDPDSNLTEAGREAAVTALTVGSTGEKVVPIRAAR